LFLLVDKEEEKNAHNNIPSISIVNDDLQSELNPNRPRVQSLSSSEEHELGQFEFDSVCRLHKTAVTQIVPHPSLPSTHLLTIGDDGFLRNYMVDKSKIDTFYFISSRPLTCLKSIPVYLSINKNERSSLAFIGSADHSLYIYNLETGTSLLSKVLHDDVITSLYITNRSTPTLLCTSSNDATVRFWSLENLLFTNDDNYIFQPNYHLASIIEMQYDISFDSCCTCMHVLEEHGLLAVGCQDGSIYLCHFQTGEIIKQLTSSLSPILSLSIRSDGLFLAYLTSTTVTLVDILSGTDVFTKTCLLNNQSFTCLFYSSQMLIVGLSNGSCDVWNLKICEKVHSLNICDNIAITTITHNDGMFFFGTDDGSVHSYVFASRQQLSI
jgi:WD40 repeat protein